MRQARIALFAAVLFFLLMSAGCVKTWSIDFTSPDATNWDTLFSYDAPGITTKEDYGLVLSGTTMRATYGFNGDIEFTVKFDLSVSNVNTVEEMRVFLGNGLDPESQKIECRLMNIGDSSNEMYYIYDNTTEKHSAVYISGIKHNDINELTISIKGGIVDITMNGAKLIDPPFEIVNYNAPFFFPYVFVQQGSPPEGEERVLIKSIKVVYSGDKQKV